MKRAKLDEVLVRAETIHKASSSEVDRKTVKEKGRMLNLTLYQIIFHLSDP